jgi:hypothetical protein
MGRHGKILVVYFQLVIPDAWYREAIWNPAQKWIPGSR